MCEFLSFCVDKNGNVYVGDMSSHHGIEGGHGLKPGEYREAEWTGECEDSLTVRVEKGEHRNFYRALILGRWPTRKDLLKWVKRGKTDEAKYWYLHGELHRTGDRPAIERANGTKQWWRHGKQHRDGDKPAYEGANGTKEWWRHGKQHRDGDKPAVVERANGTKFWYRDGKRHRDGGKPAVVWVYGTKEWWRHGKLHRDGDKPAYEGADGGKEWWVEGIIQKAVCPEELD